MARFLIIEDDAASRALLSYLLEAFGHETITAADGAEGLCLARSIAPDMILCDLRMPVLDGHCVLREIRADAALRDLVVVAVTAYSMPGDREQGMQASFDGYLTKPIIPETVVGELEALLAARHRRP